MNIPLTSAPSVLFLTLEFPPSTGGVQRMYEQLCREAPLPLRVWTTTPEAVATTRAYSVERVPLLAKAGWPRWRSTLRLLYRELKKNEAAAIIVGHVLPLGIPVWILSLFYPIRYAVFLHGMDLAGPLEHWRQRWMVKRILRRAHVVLAASKHVAALVKPVAPRARIEIIYPSSYLIPTDAPTDRAVLRTRLDLKKGDIIFLTIARLVARKGHAVVLRAFARLLKTMPAIRYVIVGDGPEATRLRDLVSTLAIDKQVLFVSSASDEVAKTWLQVSDIFIMTPQRLPGGDIEGVGIVYLEASSFGLPIIATRSGAVSEAVRDGHTGLLVAENNVDETYEAMKRLAENATLRQAFANQGKRFVAEHFNPALAARRMCRALL